MKTVLCLAISLLSVPALQGEEPELTASAYVLPMIAAPGADDADVFTGAGVQLLLENVLVVDGALQEHWAWWQYDSVFPKQDDLERYLKGQAKEPAAIRTLSHRWLVSGGMRDASRVALALEDRKTGKRVSREIPLDFPKLLEFRRSFLAMLKDGGVPISAARESAMLWPEDLNRRAMALLGRGYVLYCYHSAAIPDFLEGLKLAPHSYLLLDSQGFVHEVRKQYTDADAVFRKALQENPDGFDALGGLLDVTAQKHDLAEARKVSAEAARVRGEAADAPEALIRLSKTLERFKQFDAAEQLLQTRSQQETDPAVRRKLDAGLASVYAQHARGIARSDRPGANQLYEVAIELEHQLKDQKEEARLLSDAAVSYRQAGQYQKAVAAHEKELAIHRELKDREGEILALQALGHTLAAAQKKTAAMQRFDEATAAAREMGNRRLEAGVLASVGSVESDTAQYQLAVERYQQSLQIYRDLKDRAHEETILERLAINHFILSQYQLSTQEFEQAVAIIRESKDKRAEARLLQDLAMTCARAGRYQEAIGWFEKALPLFRELKDRANELNILPELGWSHHMVKDEESAAQTYQHALDMIRDSKDRAAEARFLAGIANLAWQVHQYKDAAEWYEKSLPVFRETGDRKGEEDALDQLGWSYFDLHQYADATHNFQLALAIAAEMKDKTTEAGVLEALGLCSSTAKQYKEAVGWYEKALPMLREIKNRESEQSSLRNSGWAHHMVHDDQAAVRDYQLGLAIARQRQDRPAEAKFLNDIGYVFWLGRQYRESIAWYEKALPVQHELKLRVNEANTLHQLGLNCEWLHDYKKGIEWFGQELPIRRELKDRLNEARNLYSLGLCQRRVVKYDEAMSCFDQATGIYRELNRPADQAQTLMGTADTYQARRQYPKAAELYEEALAIARNTKSRSMEALLLERIGYSNRLAKNTEQSVRSFEQALQIRRELKDREREANTVEGIAKTYEASGNTQKAIEAYEQELGIWRELNNAYGVAAMVGKLGDAYNRLGQYAKALSYYEQRVTARQDEKLGASRVTTVENDFELLEHENPAFLVLPFSAGKAVSDNDRPIGVALQLVLENVVMELPDVRQAFLTLNMKTAFHDLDQWNGYLRGDRPAPHLQGFTCVVGGQLDRQGDQYTLALTFQHEDGKVSGAALPVDFPHFRQVRTAFVQELHNAKCGLDEVQLEDSKGALWPEAIDIAAARALGRGRAEILASRISQQAVTRGDLDEASRLAPQSYLAAMNRAFGYQQMGQATEALSFYDQAIAMARTAKKPVSEVVMLSNRCGAYTDAKQTDKAVAPCEQALARAQEIKNPDTESLALANLGSMYSTQENYLKAVGYYEHALNIAHEITNQSMVGFALTGVANAYYRLQRFENAAIYYDQAAQFAAKTGDRGSEGAHLFNLGLSYGALRQYPKAIASYRQALLISRELKDRNSEVQLLYYTAAAHVGLGETQTALAEYQQSAEIAADSKNRAWEREAIVGVAVCSAALGRNQQATDNLEQSLVIGRELKNPNAVSDSLMRLGQLHAAANQFGKALEEFNQSLAAARDAKNRSTEGATLFQIGSLYVRAHQNDRAFTYYQQALAAARDAKDRAAQANYLESLGAVYSGLGRRAEARINLNQALEAAIEVKDRALQGRILTPLGRLDLELGQSDKAIGRFEQARLVAHERKDLDGETVAQINLGYANFLLKRFDVSTAEFEKALAVAREGKLSELEAQALGGLMISWTQRGQPRLAILFGKRSINLLQETRADLKAADSSMQQSFAKNYQPFYRMLADLLAGLGRLAEAQQVIDLLKEEELSAFVERAKDVASGQGQATLTSQETEWEKRYREIGDRLTATGVRRGSLLAKPDRSTSDDQELAKLESDLEVGNRAFKAFLDRMEESFRDAKGGQEEVVKVREAEGLMETLRDLGSGTVAVYTVIGEKGLRSILVTPDVQKGYFTPIPEAELNKKILAFREVVRNPAMDPVPLAKELYNLLVKPMEKDLEGAQAQTIMWSLDGALRYVPIAALHDGQHYLVERYRNVVFTPASQSRLKDPVSHSWRGLGLGVSQAHEGFQALPNVPAELHSIIHEDASTALGVVPGTVKLDADFTKDALRVELRKHYSMVHMASHFDFVPGTDKNSYLLLGDGGKLTLDEFRTMPQVLQGVELLTLSACDTAVGGEGADGKEVEGFAVLAQRQGAKAVIATLWQVADASTTLLMQEFYRLHSTSGNLTKAEALRQAQVALLTGTLKGDDSGNRGTIAAQRTGSFAKDLAKPYAHPYFWAPFLLMGNWK